MEKKLVINFFESYVDKSASRAVRDVLESTFLSEGKLVSQFEQELKQKLGLVNPVAVNSGTSALHLAVVLAGVKAGDEVILPAQTFVASAMAVLYERAKPVFADIQYQTGNLDPDSVAQKITEKTKAIMVVHWGGNPVDLAEIQAIAKKHKLVVVEDAAHALGATYQGRPIGSISPFTCFSFQAIKHLTTGDGGAVCVLDEILGKEAFKRRWFGIDRAGSLPSALGERVFDISSLGYKYHLNDYSAALGLANLRNLVTRLERRRKIADRYRTKLARVSGLTLFKRQTDRLGSCWLFGCHVEDRDDFIAALKSRGVPTSVVHQGIDRFTICGGIRPDLVNQRKFDQTQIHLPAHDQLTDYQVAHIIKSIKAGW